MRSVWSRVASVSITVVSPAACRPAIRTADLICAEGTGSRYSIGTRSRCRARQAAAVSRSSSTSSPICFSGLSTRPIGRRRERGIAHQPHRHVVAGDHAHHQPRAGAGVAEIERGVRAGAGRRRRAPAPLLARALNSPAPSASSALAVLSTSSASSRPRDARHARWRARRSIRARCEIDLSPGTRTRPVSGRRRRP